MAKESLDFETDSRPMGIRSFDELRTSGLLWLINRVVFHPRGFALVIARENGSAVGWKLQGDGTEVWCFEDDEDSAFAAVKRTLGGE